MDSIFVLFNKNNNGYLESQTGSHAVEEITVFTKK
jgi:hypothetical protein